MKKDKDYKSCNIGTKETGKDGAVTYFAEYGGDGCCEGEIYKNYDAFYNPDKYAADEVVYIPEYGFPQNGKYAGTREECDVFTRKDFLELCDGNEEKALDLFTGCNWQFPTTLLDEWDADDEEQEDNA